MRGAPLRIVGSEPIFDTGGLLGHGSLRKTTKVESYFRIELGDLNYISSQASCWQRTFENFNVTITPYPIAWYIPATSTSTQRLHKQCNTSHMEPANRFTHFPSNRNPIYAPLLEAGKTIAEHPKSKSTRGFYQADVSPCSWPLFAASPTQILLGN